ncbi:luciferase family protein [Nitrososphaera sp.]|uniref:luciferase family protein n=1 Tax=Nitrososphaera sp. TaxID=1971748 RepID=UPI00307DBD79
MGEKPSTVVAAAASGASVEEMVEKEVMSWPGVTCGPHRFGGTEFRVNGREMGHMHGSSWAVLPFPVELRNRLVASGILTSPPPSSTPNPSTTCCQTRDGSRFT